MTEQAIRAKALEIAVLNYGGRLFRVAGGQVVFGQPQLEYIGAVEKYIADGIYTDASPAKKSG